MVRRSFCTWTAIHGLPALAATHSTLHRVPVISGLARFIQRHNRCEMTPIVISSGHGLKIRGARGNPVPPQLDEVDQARRVVPAVVAALRSMGHTVTEFHDDVSTTQSANLNWIVNHHNGAGPHDLDVSVHFNAYNGTANGCEVLY